MHSRCLVTACLAVLAWSACVALPTLLFADPLTSAQAFKGLRWETTQAGRPLDLTGYRSSFHDSFAQPDITLDGGAGPWYAPVHSSFGAATFLPPGLRGPFSFGAMGLTIRADRQAGTWHSGLLQSVDSHGHGFSQQYGYFEMTAAFPPGPGSWPAFWLLSRTGLTDPTLTRAEIDVVEWYGGDPKGLHSTVHLWPPATASPNALARHVSASSYYKMKLSLVGGQLTGSHSYGAEINPERVIIYFDRHELARFPTVPEFKTPLYLLANLALFPGEAGQAASPKEMRIAQISVYSKN